jgi:hypothetical protein
MCLSTTSYKKGLIQPFEWVFTHITFAVPESQLEICGNWKLLLDGIDAGMMASKEV